MAVVGTSASEFSAVVASGGVARTVDGRAWADKWCRRVPPGPFESKAGRLRLSVRHTVYVYVQEIVCA